MFSDPLFLVTAFFAVLLVGLAKGGFSGIGMAATPLLALSVPPLQALAILLPILLVQDIVSIWWYRRDYDGWNLKVMLPGAIFGVGIAWVVGSLVSDDVVRLIIGVIGVTPWLASASTSLTGTERLNAHEVKIQKIPTTRTATMVATGISRLGVLASSATVLATSNPVNDRMPNSTA